MSAGSGIPPLNDQVLREVYTQCLSRPSIRRYLLNDQVSVPDVAARITQLLANHPWMIATFPTMPPESLQGELSQKKYLVIQKQALSLSSDSEAPAEAEARFKDVFTESLLTEPIKCSQGHCLEKHRAVLWTRLKGDECPMGLHPIGPLEIAHDCQRDLTTYKNQKEEEELAFPLLREGNPRGEQILEGMAIIRRRGNTLLIQQQTEKVVILWQDFSIQAGNLIRFVQPHSSSEMINQILEAHTSSILGTLEANGKIVLSNPNGMITIGPDAVINVHNLKINCNLLNRD